MSKNAFADPRKGDWVAETLKELERGPKIANEPESAKPTESPATQKQLIIINQKANYLDSMKILADKGLRPLTYQEALVEINQNPELKEQLKGKWFYLEGKGPALSGYYTFNKKGELTLGKGDADKTVYVWKGPQPLSLEVIADYRFGAEGRYFTLDTYGRPDVVASVVVGIKY